MRALRPLILSQPAVMGALALAFLLTVGTGWLGVVSTQHVLAANARTEEAQEKVLLIQQLLNAVTAAEAGQRGYLLTGEETYLEPYRESIDRIEPMLVNLQQRWSLREGRAEEFTRLKTLVQAKLGEMSTTIALRREKSIGAALNHLETDRGRVLMEQIREFLGQLETVELTELRVQSNVTARRTERSLHVSLGLIAVAVVLTGTAALVLVRRIRDLRTMITVCAWTKRVKWKGRWVSFEEFLEERFSILSTHGICEEAAQQFRAEADQIGAARESGTTSQKSPAS